MLSAFRLRLKLALRDAYRVAWRKCGDCLQYSLSFGCGNQNGEIMKVVEKESDIERFLVDTVEMIGGQCRKVKWLGRCSAPDRRLMLPYLQCWVELKAFGKQPTAAQKREHKRMRDCGERVEVINSCDSVVELLKGAI